MPLELLQDTDLSHTTIAPHWSSSYPEYLSPNWDKDTQQAVVWMRLLELRCKPANCSLAQVNEHFCALRQEQMLTQAESSHEPSPRDKYVIKLSWWYFFVLTIGIWKQIDWKITASWDGWLTKCRCPYSAFAVHYINYAPNKPNDWFIKSHLLAFEPTIGCHTRNAIGHNIVNILERFGITDKVSILLVLAFQYDDWSLVTSFMSLLVTMSQSTINRYAMSARYLTQQGSGWSQKRFKASKLNLSWYLEWF